LRLLTWGPLGVRNALEAQNEYDCPIGPLMQALHDGATINKLADLPLHELEDHFGVSANPIRERALAADLNSCQWWLDATGGLG